MRVISLLTLSFSTQFAFSWQSVRRSCVTSLTRTSAHFRSNNICSSRTSSSLLFGKAKSQNEEKVSNEEDDSRQTKLNNNQILLQELDNKFSYDGRMRQHQQMETAHPQNDSRFGYVGLVGAPNMGKSTLLNALIREDLCVASRRPQTTRHAILGILSEENVQLAFTDTPGVIENPSYMLQEGMMEAVKGALNEADVILLVTDVFSTPIPDDTLFNKIQHLSSTGAKPVIVAVNKVDMLEKFLEKRRKWELQKQNQVQVIGALENNQTESTSIAEFEEDANDEFVDQDEDMKTFSIEDAVWRWRTLLPNAVAIIPVIATDKNNLGVDCLRTLLCGVADVPEAIRNLGRPIPGMFQEGVKFISNQDARSLIPLGPPLYDQDTLTDRTERFFASEMIRAAIFEEFKKEIPYCTEVQITEFKESKPEDGNKSTNSKLSSIIRMSATIFVERESQKGIVVGTGGNQIKKVGIRARKSLETFFQSKVYLELRVKVEKDWRSKEDRLKKFGYIN